MADQAPESVPKAVRGTPLETEEGPDSPAQQPAGPASREGGGEWPSPSTPPRPPAPGAAEADDEVASGPESGDPQVNRLVEQALALADREVPEREAATELFSAAGGDEERLAEAERVCSRNGDGQRADVRQAAAYLAAARSA